MRAQALALVLAVVIAAPAHASGDDARRAYRAGQAAASKSEQRRHHAAGVALAREALRKDPRDPAALLWLAANLGAEALTHGKLYALRVIGEIERTLLELERLHPLYDHAAAARSLGRLYHKAPAVISVGSNEKAALYLGRALARAPEFPGNQAFAAELYADRGDCRAALPLARRVLATPRLEAFGPDAKEWREIAADVIDECD